MTESGAATPCENMILVGWGGITYSLKRKKQKSKKQTGKFENESESQMNQRCAQRTRGTEVTRSNKCPGGISGSADSEILGKRGGAMDPWIPRWVPKSARAVPWYGRIHKIPPGEAQMWLTIDMACCASWEIGL